MPGLMLAPAVGALGSSLHTAPPPLLPLDSRELVLTGLVAYLTPRLGGLVDPANIHASWQQVNLAGDIGQGPGQQPSLVILDLGEEKPQTPQPIRNEWTVTLPAKGPGVATATRYVAEQSEHCPLTITAVACGEAGATRAGTIAATVRTALAGAGGTFTLPLPDDNTSVPPTFAVGLVAQLIRQGGRPHTRDSVRQIYAQSLLYTAYYADYHTETPTVVKTVTLDETFTLGATAWHQVVNRTTP